MIFNNRFGNRQTESATFWFSHLSIADLCEAVEDYFLVFFVDAFVGIGPGRYEITSTETITETEEEILFNRFVVNNRDWQIGTKGFFFSRTAGIRLCLAL